MKPAPIEGALSPGMGALRKPIDTASVIPASIPPQQAPFSTEDVDVNATETAQKTNMLAAVMAMNQGARESYDTEADFWRWKAASCSAASFAAFYNAYTGESISISDALRMIEASQAGADISPGLGLHNLGGAGESLAIGMNQNGLPAEAKRITRQELEGMLGAGQPVVLQFSGWGGGGHWAVATGLKEDGSGITVADSGYGRTELSWAEVDAWRRAEDNDAQTGGYINGVFATGDTRRLPSGAEGWTEGEQPAPQLTIAGAANPNASSEEVEAYIRQAASARGIDPDVAVRVALGEGGFDVNRRGTFDTGSSWWPFQLHYGGAGYEGYGHIAGMGNSFTAETGFQPGDPAAWQASVDYALNEAARKRSWADWYGRVHHGVGANEGFDQTPQYGDAVFLGDRPQYSDAAFLGNQPAEYTSADSVTQAQTARTQNRVADRVQEMGRTGEISGGQPLLTEDARADQQDILDWQAERRAQEMELRRARMTAQQAEPPEVVEPDLASSRMAQASLGESPEATRAAMMGGTPNEQRARQMDVRREMPGQPTLAGAVMEYLGRPSSAVQGVVGASMEGADAQTIQDRFIAGLTGQVQYSAEKNFLQANTAHFSEVIPVEEAAGVLGAPGYALALALNQMGVTRAQFYGFLVEAVADPLNVVDAPPILAAKLAKLGGPVLRAIGRAGPEAVAVAKRYVERAVEVSPMPESFGGFRPVSSAETMAQRAEEGVPPSGTEAAQRTTRLQGVVPPETAADIAVQAPKADMEYPSYGSDLLKAAGKGEPGLQTLKQPDGHVELFYSDPDGTAVGYVALDPPTEGRSYGVITDMALDKNRGLLSGRAVAELAEAVKPYNIRSVSGGVSPEAAQLAKRLSQQPTPPAPAAAAGEIDTIVQALPEKPNAASAAKAIRQAEKAGYQAEDAKQALQDYKDIHRGDYDDVDDYASDRQDAWDAFRDALENAERQADEVAELAPAPAAQAAQPSLIKDAAPPAQPPRAVSGETAVARRATGETLPTPVPRTPATVPARTSAQVQGPPPATAGSGQAPPPRTPPTGQANQGPSTPPSGPIIAGYTPDEAAQAAKDFEGAFTTKGFDEAKGPLSVRVREQVTDDLAALETLQRDVEKILVTSLPEGRRAYDMARLYRGVEGKVERRIWEVGDLLRPVRDRLDDVRNLWYADRFKEVLQRFDENIQLRDLPEMAEYDLPGHLTPKKIMIVAEETRKKLIREGRYDEAQAAVQGLKNFYDRMLRDMLNARMLSASEYRAIRSGNQSYAPLKRASFIADKLLDEGIHFGGRNVFSVASNEIRSLKRAGSKRQVLDPWTQMERDIARVTSLVERNKVAAAVHTWAAELPDLFKVLDEGQAAPSGWDTFNYVKDGQKVRVATEQWVADAMKHLTPPQANIAMQIVRTGANMLRLGAVTLSPVFAARNILRDPAGALIRQGTTFRWLVEGLLTAINAKAPRAVRHKAAWQNYLDYLESGAAMSGMFESIGRGGGLRVREAAGAPTLMMRGKKLLSVPFDALKTPGELSEQMTRMGTYLQKRAEGKTTMASAMASRESTFDFQKAGTAMRAMNQVVPFLNARLQAELSLLYRAKADKKVALRALVFGGMPSIALIAWNMRDQESAALYNDVQDWERRENHILVVGSAQDRDGTTVPLYWAIPKDTAHLILGTVVESAVRYAIQDNPEAWYEIAGELAQELSPFGTIEPKGIMASMTPPPVKAALQDTANYDFFRNQPIVPESEQDLPPERQVGPYTTESAQTIGGALDLSPRRVEAFARTAAGSLPTTVMGAVDTGGRMARGEQSSPIDLEQPWRSAGLDVFFKARGSETEDQRSEAYKEALEAERAAAFERLKQEPRWKNAPSEDARNSLIRSMEDEITQRVQKRLGDEGMPKWAAPQRRVDPSGVEEPFRWDPQLLARSTDNRARAMYEQYKDDPAALERAIFDAVDAYERYRSDRLAGLNPERPSWQVQYLALLGRGQKFRTREWREWAARNRDLLDERDRANEQTVNPELVGVP